MMIPFTAATACSLASILTPAVAFIIPRTLPPIQSSALSLFQEDGAPYPPSGKKGSSLVNATLIGDNLNIANEETDVVGAGTFGDIMAGSGSKDDITKQRSSTTVIDGLVTKEGGELNARFGCNFTPMERIALTANGNLQRIFSSYYDAPVHVHVDSCSRRENSPMNGEDIPQIGFNHSSIGFDPTIKMQHVINGGATWDRVVHIQVHDQTICRATSIISVQSPLCVRLIEDGSIGLGQMFRYLNRLPTFSLLDAGRTKLGPNEFQGGIWRTYELQCEEMTCLIHEELRSDAWNIISEQY
mmetsp:Transcript_27925/g.51489  ORF Transcript_27925/g.51489 Transcript_27925/m.51489 type:complete len:300 (+) Transcript_27925:164-1063(+)